jgi:hypothetical protein
MQTLLTIIAIISIPGAIFFARYMIAEGNNVKQEYEKPVLRIFSTELPKKKTDFPKWAKEFKVGTCKESFEDKSLLRAAEALANSINKIN